MVDVDDTARRLYNRYRALMNNHGIRYDLEYEEDIRIWQALATKVSELGLEPIMFMEAQFLSVKDPRTLTPRKLSGKHFRDAAKRYYRQVPRTPKEIHRKHFGVFMNQLGAYGSRLIPSRYGNRNELLTDVNMPFPAWFRLLLADNTAPGFNNVINKYQNMAQQDYCEDPGLRAFLAELGDTYDGTRIQRLV